jgi:hypothetical protein
MAIWYDTKELIRCIAPGSKRDVQCPYGAREYTLRDGSLQPTKVRLHPDPRAQTVVEQVREAEMVQAIDRLRREAKFGASSTVDGGARVAMH